VFLSVSVKIALTTVCKLYVILVLNDAYRNWRYEQEIAGLLWKIAREDLKTSDSMSGSERRESFGSRVYLLRTCNS